MEQTKVALLGLGLMGSGMAGRLLDAGYPRSYSDTVSGCIFQGSLEACKNPF